MNILIDGQTLESAELNRGIGVYFKNVLNNMIKQNFDHNWFIAVSKENSLATLDPWVAKRINPVINDFFSPSSDFSRTESYTQALESAVSTYKINAFWSPNPLMVNVLFPIRQVGCKMFLTVHDVIPAIIPVKEWSKAVKEEYFRRLKFINSQKDVTAICVSRATENDVKKCIGEAVNTVVTLEAANSRLFYHKREKSGINEDPYIVFTGGFDYRKNIDGAVRAFSLAKKRNPNDSVLQKIKLYIVCKASSDIQEAFYKKVDHFGLSGFVKLTGYIPDEQLSDLYANADLFFFPSLYEGFGLPILEAMLGGAYILSADNSSLPEVCSKYAVLCNAKSDEDMADKLRLALYNASKESVEDKLERQNYALTYSWEKTAMQTLCAFESNIEKKSAHREKIAIMTPWPTQMTGIANYVYKLMPYLIHYFDVDVFVDNTIDKKSPLVENPYGGLYTLQEFEARATEYDEVIYQIGNESKYHTGIYEYARKYKGIAEIHDFILSPFFYHSFFLKKKYDIYRQVLEDGYGKTGLKHYEKIRSGQSFPDESNFPMSHSVSNICKATIFHNHWSEEQIKQNKIFVVPHACFDKEFLEDNQREDLLRAIKQKCHITDSETIIGCFGFINKNKRPEKVIEAISNLLQVGKNVRLIFFGKPSSEDITQLINKRGLQDKVYITGYLEKGEYEIGMEMCDIVVNLRFPSMGEASGTLCEAFKFGKPVLVSEVNQYVEYPDEICWKVVPGPYEVTLLTEMLEYLIDNPDVRRALGENAQAYADTVLSPEKISKRYYDIIMSFKEK